MKLTSLVIVAAIKEGESYFGSKCSRIMSTSATVKITILTMKRLNEMQCINNRFVLTSVLARTFKYFLIFKMEHIKMMPEMICARLVPTTEVASDA